MYTITLNVNEKPVIFNKISCPGATSNIYITADKKYILKQIIHFDEYNVYEREVHILNLLNEKVDWCPKLIHTDNKKKYIIISYCGVNINKNNKPKKYVEQINNILKDLKDLNIQHNDIKNEEVLVLDDKIFICDFGWASINNNFNCGINISSKIKPCGILKDVRIFDRIKI